MTPGLLARATVFTSGLVLFMVQPLFARAVLPRLGGSAQVWNGCTVFFQLTLLAGYGYAHLSRRRLGSRSQAAVHLALVGLSLAWMPLTLAPATSSGGSGSPLVWLPVLLAGTVGLPFFALSATASLVQHWFVESGQEGSEDPYFLYAAGNAGALVALVAYPLVVEPNLALDSQARVWSVAYGLFAVLIGLDAWALRRAAGPRKERPDRPGPDEASWSAARSIESRDSLLEELPPRARPPGSPLSWVMLSLTPASLMLGVTAHVTNEIPSFPLVWIVPLTLYLLSFVLVFGRRPLVPHRVVVAVQPILVAMLAVIMFVPLRLAGLCHHLVTFLVTALVLHGELAARRPSADRSSEYYLWIAVGGAAGGLFNALVAPLLFPCVLEYPLAVVAACLLRPRAPDHDPGTRSRRLDLAAPALLGAAAIGTFLALPFKGDERDVVVRVAFLFFFAAVAHYFRGRPLRFGLGVAAVLAGGFLTFQAQGTLVIARSYYGVTRVVREPGTGRHVFYHGTTIHGAQDPGKDRPGRPTLYFHPESPIGRLMTSSVAARRARRFGVLGLGVGSLAWYLRPHQAMWFFEIDPVVGELATDRRLFTYLSSSRGVVDVVIGDGRLSMAGERDRSFDLIVADAFCSDAVPVHLITREALLVYMRKLAPGGALLFNTSNRHLDLAGVVAAIARAQGWECRATDPVEVERPGQENATWAMVTGSRGDLQGWIAGDGRWRAVAAGPGAPLWTDGYANILAALR